MKPQKAQVKPPSYFRAAQVAEWAGHSVEVLLWIYTHCLDEGEREALWRIQRALADTTDGAETARSTSGVFGASSHRHPVTATISHRRIQYRKASP